MKRKPSPMAFVRLWGHRRPGGEPATTGGRRPATKLRSRSEVRAAVAAMPADNPDALLRIQGLDPLRVVTLVGQGTRVAGLRLVITDVTLPWSGWRGSLRIPGVDVRIRWPEGRSGTVAITVT